MLTIIGAYIPIIFLYNIYTIIYLFPINYIDGLIKAIISLYIINPENKIN